MGKTRMAEPKTFEEFWPYYLRAHSRPETRALHYAATTIIAGSFAAWLVTRKNRYLAFTLLGVHRRGSPTSRLNTISRWHLNTPPGRSPQTCSCFQSGSPGGSTMNSDARVSRTTPKLLRRRHWNDEGPL